MPRKSANQLAMEEVRASLPGGSEQRPEPPPDTPAAAAAVWRDAVSSMKARHFTRETHALLTRYCNAMAICSQLEAELARTDLNKLEYTSFLKKLNTTAATALSYARALRLTPKSNLDTRASARDPHRIMGPKPWEWGGNDDTPRPRKMWEE